MKVEESIRRNLRENEERWWRGVSGRLTITKIWLAKPGFEIQWRREREDEQATGKRTNSI